MRRPAASAAFYDAVLAPLGGGRVMDFGDVIGYGVGAEPDVLDRPAHRPASRFREIAHRVRRPPTGRRCARSSRRRWRAGAEVLHEPRVWPEYHPDYYGAFVRDPDGNNVEAVCHPPE